MIKKTKNIFKNAKFGDKFITHDGEIALYLRKHPSVEGWHSLITEKFLENISVNNKGQYLGDKEHKSSYDIVSLWKEPIDEEKLNRIAKEYEENYPNMADPWYSYYCYDGFKAGYIAAKNE